MGNLHAGHLSLIKHCTQENDITVVSIFINPTQFNNTDDFENYPQTLEEDIKLAHHADYILAPIYKEIYPDDFTFKVTESLISQKLEGKHRPEHFDGMLTIVLKLFCLIQPQRAYFGEKDYQQLLLVQKLTEAFFLNIEIVPCKTVRSETGLALSSRNNRLSPEEKLLAEKFPELLRSNHSLEEIKKNLKNLGFLVDYIEEMFGRRLGAVQLGNVRLIDNIKIK